MNPVYDKVLQYVHKYHGGVAWRLKTHSHVVELHLNPGEEVIYAFPGQKNDNFWAMFSTCVVCLTNHRILIGQKHLIFGYSLTSITPDLFNDMEVYQGLIWGKVTIDTIKEVVILTNLDKHSLPDIETNITQFMMKEKEKYGI